MAGGRVGVKLRRGSQQIFDISKGGVWRVVGGEECQVRNAGADGEGKEDAVVHVIRIA